MRAGKGFVCIQVNSLCRELERDCICSNAISKQSSNSLGFQVSSWLHWKSQIIGHFFQKPKSLDNSWQGSDSVYGHLKMCFVVSSNSWGKHLAYWQLHALHVLTCQSVILSVCYSVLSASIPFLFKTAACCGHTSEHSDGQSEKVQKTTIVMWFQLESSWRAAVIISCWQLLNYPSDITRM